MVNALKIVLVVIGFSLLVQESFSQGDAPAILKGRNQADKSIGAFIQTPNGQVTKISSSSALIETGNNNILENPNFEHSVYDTSWVVGSGVSSKVTIDTNATKVFSGLNALQMTMTAATLDVFNVSPTGNQAYKDGTQGLVSVRIKTTVPGIRVCQRKGFSITTNCVNVNPDGKWGLYKIPSILGEFYNGVQITSTPTAVTGDVYIDDAFVGVTDIAQISSAIGPDIAYTPTVTAAIGTITNYSVTGSYRQVGAYAYVSGKITFTGAVGTWTQPKISMPSGLTINTSIQPVGFVKDSSTLIQDIGATEYGEGKNYVIDSSTLAIFSSFRNIAIAVYSDNITQASPFAFASGDIISWSALVPVTQFSGSVSTYSSPMLTNADRIGEVIQTTNSTAPQGFISALNKSIGQTGSGATFTGQTYFALYEHLWSIAGLTTTAGDVYRISSAKGASASADFAANKIITIDYETNAPFIRGKASAAGVGAYTADQFQGHWHRFNQTQAPNAGVLVTSSGSEVVPFMRSTGTGNASVAAANGITDPWDASGYGTARFGQETRPKNVSLNIFIRFAGDTQLITGQFNGLQSCTSTLACTDTFSAKVTAAGVVSSQNTNFINGSCSVTAAPNKINCTFNSGLFTVSPSCVAQNNGASTGSDIIATTATSSGFSVNYVASVVREFDVICQKQGADYIGKTAMAVASDQNVRSIGSTNVDIQSVYFGSSALCNTQCTTGNCTICGQVGSKITSVQFSSAGIYLVNGIDSTKYMCSGSGHTTVASVALSHARNAGSPTTQAVIEASGANVRNATFTCIGIP